MSREQIRLECLRLASERLGPAAPIAELFAEARRLLAFVDGFDTVEQHDGDKIAWRKV